MKNLLRWLGLGRREREEVTAQREAQRVSLTSPEDKARREQEARNVAELVRWLDTEITALRSEDMRRKEEQ